MTLPYSPPVPCTPADAIAQLELDLPLILKGMPLEQSSWVRVDPLTLLVPVAGIRADCEPDLYFLRLQFGYYRTFPPSAQFVNPLTLRYDASKDKAWLPKIDGNPEIAVHADYQNKGQLICCSATLEFYLVGHTVEPKHVWDPKSQNFAATLNAVRRGLRSNFYKGRQR
jgi:hypothetical protein